MTLKKFREEKKLTKQEMADILGITKSMYEKLEYGLRKPSLKTLKSFKEKFADFDINIFLN